MLLSMKRVLLCNGINQLLFFALNGKESEPLVGKNGVVVVVVVWQGLVGKRGVVIYFTNLQNKGWISADRGTRATLMRTIPRSLFKSYTKDLSLPIFELVLQPRLRVRLTVPLVPWQCYDLELYRSITYTYSWKYLGKQEHIAAFQHGFWLRGVQP